MWKTRASPQQRAAAIRAHEAGASASDIAILLSVHENTVRSWVRDQQRIQDTIFSIRSENEQLKLALAELILTIRNLNDVDSLDTSSAPNKNQMRLL